VRDCAPLDSKQAPDSPDCTFPMKSA
jgi:hypothetical protein